MNETKQLTRIDFKTRTFKANGHDYYISDVIPVGRDVRYTNLVPKLSFGHDFSGIMGFVKKIYGYATSGNDPLNALFKVATDCYNMMESIRRLKEDEWPVYYEMAAIFCNRVDEDVKQLTDQMVLEKIDDWNKEGIPREDFFALAISSINGLAAEWQRLEEEIAKNQK
jgi:hypothetical protein